MSDCGPYVCAFPQVHLHQAGDRWTCPTCGTTYQLSRPVPWRWWRNWAAPLGHWRLSWRDRLRMVTR